MAGWSPAAGSFVHQGRSLPGQAPLQPLEPEVVLQGPLLRQWMVAENTDLWPHPLGLELPLPTRRRPLPKGLRLSFCLSLPFSLQLLQALSLIYLLLSPFPAHHIPASCS